MLMGAIEKKKAGLGRVLRTIKPTPPSWRKRERKKFLTSKKGEKFSYPRKDKEKSFLR